MSAASNFFKKALDKPEMAQLVFHVAVLDKYLESGVKVQRTETVARVKAATWSLDLGIAPDEQTLHTSIALFARVPDAERAHWLENLEESNFSSNFLKMQGGHSCVDDGGLRKWGEEEGLI